MIHVHVQRQETIFCFSAPDSTRSTETKKQNSRPVRLNLRFCFLAPIHVDFWAPRNKFRTKHGQLHCVAFPPVSSLGAKKQLLGAKKQLTGLPPWPGDGSAIFSWFRPLRFDSIRLVRTSVGRRRRDNRSCTKETLLPCCRRPY